MSARVIVWSPTGMPVAPQNPRPRWGDTPPTRLTLFPPPQLRLAKPNVRGWLTAGWLIAVVFSVAGVGFAEEPSPPRAKSHLEQQLDELDLADRQLAQAREQLASTKNRALRRKLQARIDDLKTQQERLLFAIEQVVGPLPPVVRPEPPLPLEEDLKAQQRHHEAILESDVQRRLPGN